MSIDLLSQFLGGEIPAPAIDDFTLVPDQYGRGDGLHAEAVFGGVRAHGNLEGHRVLNQIFPQLARFLIVAHGDDVEPPGSVALVEFRAALEQDLSVFVPGGGPKHNEEHFLFGVRGWVIDHRGAVRSCQFKAGSWSFCFTGGAWTWVESRSLGPGSIASGDPET